MGKWLAGIGRVLRDSVWGFAHYARLLRAARPWTHLTLLAVILTLVGATVFLGHLGSSARQWRAQLQNGPHFALRDGRFTYNGPMPMRFEQDGSLVIVDTTNSSSPDELLPYRTGFLVTSDKVYVKSDQTASVQSVPLKRLHFRVDTARVLHWLRLAVPIGVGVATPFIFGVDLLRLMTDAFLLALALLIVGAMARRKLTMVRAFALAAYALTLPAVIGLLPSYPYDREVFWGLALVYGIGGLLRAVPRGGLAATVPGGTLPVSEGGSAGALGDDSAVAPLGDGSSNEDDGGAATGTAEVPGDGVPPAEGGNEPPNAGLGPRRARRTHGFWDPAARDEPQPDDAFTDDGVRANRDPAAPEASHDDDS